MNVPTIETGAEDQAQAAHGFTDRCLIEERGWTDALTTIQAMLNCAPFNSAHPYDRGVDLALFYLRAHAPKPVAQKLPYLLPCAACNADTPACEPVCEECGGLADAEMIDCQACDGQGNVSASLYYGAHACKHERANCRTCNGAREIDAPFRAERDRTAAAKCAPGAKVLG